MLKFLQAQQSGTGFTQILATMAIKPMMSADELKVALAAVSPDSEFHLAQFTSTLASLTYAGAASGDGRFTGIIQLPIGKLAWKHGCNASAGGSYIMILLDSKVIYKNKPWF